MKMKRTGSKINKTTFFKCYLCRNFERKFKLVVQNGILVF